MTKEQSIGGAQALEERVEQAHHRGSVVGRNMLKLVRHFRRRKNTNGIALVNWIDEKIQEKYGRKFNGSIEMNVGRPVLGQKMANPKPGQLYESLGPASISGQDLRRAMYPVTLTLRNGNGVEAAAGYTLDSRVQFEGKIGFQQLDSALFYVPMLNDKKMEYKLRRLPKKQEERQVRKQKKSFDDAFESMPEEFKAEAKKNNVDLESLKNPDLLRAAPHLADKYWSAMVWAFQTKRSNEMNWFKGEAKKDRLPQDVRTAWYTREHHPHLMTREQYVLLGAYQLQARKMPRRGIAGHVSDELLWLANSRKAESARDAYKRPVELHIPHKPAAFYKGGVPMQAMTVGEKLNDPYWTMADLEGVVRKFPLSEFRRKWNREHAEHAFKNEDRFYRVVKYLAKVRSDDAAALKKSEGDLEKTRLGKDYHFVDDMLKMAKDPRTKRYSYDRLMDTLPIDRTEKDFYRFNGTANQLKWLRDPKRYARPKWTTDYFS